MGNPNQQQGIPYGQSEITLTVVMLLCVIFIVWALNESSREGNAQARVRDDNREHWEKSLIELWHSVPPISYTSEDGAYGIAIAESLGEVALYRLGIFEHFHISTVRSADVLINCSPISVPNSSDPSTKNKVAGAVVGGLIAGPAGAVVGALASAASVRRVELQLVVPDVAMPTRTLAFFSSSQAAPLGINNPRVAGAISAAQSWVMRLEALRTQHARHFASAVS